MKTRNGNIKVRALALAVGGALAAMHAMPVLADDEPAGSLRMPTNFVEIGASNVSRDSAKFGEYTGLNKSGVNLIGNFNIRGGDAYGDGNGTRRWSLTGSDLGLTSRALGATIGDQGRWSLGIGYDALRHYTSDSYQTPYLGSMGGSSFVLPAGFGAAANTRTLSPTTQLPAFHIMEVNNTRENKSLTAGFNFNRQWDIKFDFNRLDRSGAKLGSVGSAAIGGATGEKISILPIPQDDRTDTVTLALNYVGDKGHATIGYFGSFYRDNVNGFNFDTYSTAIPVRQTYGTPPSNDLHQFNMTGGYAFSGRTKVAGGFSYSRNTQNTAYAYDSGVAAAGANVGPMFAASPTVSLNGSVVTTHADLKLTDQTTRNLALSAGLKYDDRDNRTASNAYSSRAIDGSTNNGYNYPNTPLSVRKWQGELAGDYRIDARNKIRLAYNHDETKRECNQYAVIAQGTVGTNTSINAYPAGTNCVVATKTKEDKINATYRLKASNGVNLNAGYTYSDRRSDFDTNARTAMISVDDNNPALPTAQKIRGLNGGDYPGFHPFFLSNRTQHAVKAGTNWQATDKFSVGLNGRYTDDNYDGLGVQKGHSWMLNLDTTYSYAEAGAFTFYVTAQERTRDVTDQTGVLGTWTNKLKDADTTIGLALKQGGLMAGKLELTGDLTYSLAKSTYTTALNYTPAAPCTAATSLTCGDLPDIKSDLIQFKLNGTYKLDKNSKLALGYLYRRLKADDFYYNGLQNTFTPTGLLPTNQQAPSYSVNMVFVSYIYSFQ